jgi:C_GCAxxG_C_C family probable redox protein
VIEARLNEKYRGYSRQELLDKAYEVGFGFEKNSQSCSQSTVAAIHELVDMDDVVVRVASSLAGGSAVQFLGTCGGLSGGVIALDYFFGRPVEKMSWQEGKEENVKALNPGFANGRSLASKFVDEYGTFICAHIHRKLYGRIFCVTDPDEAAKFEALGAHSNPEKSCCTVVGKAARWVMEILLDKGAILL